MNDRCDESAELVQRLVFCSIPVVKSYPTNHIKPGDPLN
uniref:Uncharacterized protein n=1 Tax=Arundo donax TaxID=35708 RepID=A0A0A8ZP09_ARUDO